MVAHLLPKQRAAGSNPVSRSIFESRPSVIGWAAFYLAVLGGSFAISLMGNVGLGIVFDGLCSVYECHAHSW